MSVTVVAVGVNLIVNGEEIDFMATDPSHHAFKIENHDQLLNKVKDVTDAACLTKGKKYDITLQYLVFQNTKIRVFWRREGGGISH